MHDSDLGETDIQSQQAQLIPFGLKLLKVDAYVLVGYARFRQAMTLRANPNSQSQSSRTGAPDQCRRRFDCKFDRDPHEWSCFHAHTHTHTHTQFLGSEAYGL